MKIKNAISYEKNGWTYISIYGSPKERGYAYGTVCAPQFKKIQEMMKFNVYEGTGQTWDYFVDACQRILNPTIKEHFPEIYEEMEGIAAGCTAAGTPTTVEEISAWNNSFTLLDAWYNNSGEETGAKHVGEGGAKGASDRCSAFIAVGDYTTDGKILVAHNSFSTFIDGQYMNTILDIQPEKGNRMIMQTCPCWIWSGTDFFVTSAGIIGTETTIGGFLPYENNYTIACRIRKAMQYGMNLDDYERILLDGNSGDYANSWFFGDIHTNEIMRIELGLKYHNTEKTKNGYFVGFNATYDPRIRNMECADSGFDDIRRHQGARRVRLTDLMEENKGKLDVNLAMKLIGDHYDVYLKKENPCSRTVCSHYELDAREYMSDPSRPKPYAPRGACDGCVVDSAMAKKMSFMAKYGSSCEIPFIASEFCDKHRQWKYLEPYLIDRPVQSWTEFTITDHDSFKNEEKEKQTIEEPTLKHEFMRKFRKEKKIIGGRKTKKKRKFFRRKSRKM
jgi:hypothetical protein